MDAGIGSTGDGSLLGIMPKLIAVTPDEARAAQRIAARVRASARMCPLCEPGSRSNAARLTVGLSLPAGDLYFLLTWLDHMAGA
jgi:hypothetical protein